MKKIITIILILSLLLMLPINAEPGDNSDPLIVLSYLNLRLNELIKEYNLDKIADLEKEVEELKKQPSTDETDTSSLEVVNLNPGESLIASAGGEIILRVGNATAIVSELGGLSDVTQGLDIGADGKIPPNHLLIIPRDDGRGVKAIDNVILMVRGAYTIK